MDKDARFPNEGNWELRYSGSSYGHEHAHCKQGGGSIPYCSDQNPQSPCCTRQSTPHVPPYSEQQIVATIQQFWNSIVPIYKNDPAILYDPINEPYPPGFQNYFQDLNTEINTIRAISPNALLIVYGV